MDKRMAVVAIGGNSLIKDRYHQSVRDQYIAASETCRHIVTMIKDGWRIAITHGNGPQVGFILRRSELAAHELHELPLDVPGVHGPTGRAENRESRSARSWMPSRLTGAAPKAGTSSRTRAAAGAGWSPRPSRCALSSCGPSGGCSTPAP